MKHPEKKHAEASASLFADYATEDELSSELKKGKRTLRQWRQRRTGPPFVKVENLILYPRNGARCWLKNLETDPATDKVRRRG